MKRLQWVGLGATVLAVIVLVGSLVAGLGGAEERVETALPAEEVPTRGDRVRVEVLNAAGVSGLAHAATQRLRQQGLDVVYFGNATSFGRDSSVVLDRVGSLEMAQRVADALGISRVRTEPDTTLYLDVTVLLGHDWDRLAEENGGATESGL